MGVYSFWGPGHGEVFQMMGVLTRGCETHPSSPLPNKIKHLLACVQSMFADWNGKCLPFQISSRVLYIYNILYPIYIYYIYSHFSLPLWKWMGINSKPMTSMEPGSSDVIFYVTKLGCPLWDIQGLSLQMAYFSTTEKWLKWLKHLIDSLLPVYYFSHFSHVSTTLANWFIHVFFCLSSLMFQAQTNLCILTYWVIFPII